MLVVAHHAGQAYGQVVGGFFWTMNLSTGWADFSL